MLLGAVLLLAGVPIASPASGEAYPIADVLNSSRRACELALDSEKSNISIEAEGWQATVAESNKWVSGVLAEEREPGYPFSPSKVYSKSVSGRQLFLFVSSIGSKDSSYRLCTVQDPAAVGDGMPDQILNWAERPPVDRLYSLPEPFERKLSELSFMRGWTPGLAVGSDDTTIRYVPTNLAKQTAD